MVEAIETTEYDFPTDLEEAERAYQDLVFEVQNIQEQLGNRNRLDADGERLTGIEYWEWRNRAAGALRHRLDEVRALKAHLKELRRSATPSRGVFAVVDELVVAFRVGQSEDVMRLLPELAAKWTVKS